MSNDLQSILARHNLRGINVANFSTANPQHRPSPQQHQPYQYPAPVPQQRVQYPWGGVGQSSVPQSSVRPSFAWPAPPQPQYTIDPRHYSYNIWGKAPVYSLTGEDEEEADEEVAAEEDIEGEVDADAATEKEESIETENAAPKAVVDTTTPSANEDVPPGDPVEDAAAEPAAEEASLDVPATEQSSDPPQEECSPAIPTASEPSAEEETAAVSTETAPQESEPDLALEPIASPLAEEEAHASEPAPPDTIDGVEPDHQDSGEVIGAADPSVEESAGSEVCAPAESVENVEQKDDIPDSSKSAQEEQEDTSQPPEPEAEVSEMDIENVAEVQDPSSDESQSVDSSGGDISQEGLPSHGITTVEQQPMVEHDASPSEEQSSSPAASTEETVPMEGPTVPDDIQDTAPADPEVVIQIIEVNGDGSTDDTAAIILVDFDAPDATEDTNIPPPPPPPPAPHVTIAEPLKPSKSSKKKPSSKSTKSRHVEKPKERPVEIIPLKEGRFKPVAKTKSKKKAKGKSGKVSDVESVDLIPPPPPPLMVVDVPPPAPSPPPSGHVIEVVGTEEMQVIDETGEMDGGEEAVVIVMNSSSPNAEVDAGDAVVVEQPQVDDISNEKEESDHVADAGAASPPITDDDTPEVQQSADTAVVAFPDQHKESEPNSATADPSCGPDTGATESAEIEESPEDVAVEHKEDEAPAAISSPTEVDVIVPALDEGDHLKEAESPETENEPLHTGEETASLEPENEPPSEDSAVKSSPRVQEYEDSTHHDTGPDPEEAATLEPEKLEGTQLETAGDTDDSAPVAVSSPAEEDKANLPPAAESPSPAPDESKSSKESSDPVVEDEHILKEAKSDNTVDAATQEHSIEPAIAEDDALKQDPVPETSDPDSADTSGTDPVSNADTEALPCSDSSATVDDTLPAAPAEVVAEPAPTLMELAALILPSVPVPQAEDVAVMEEELKGRAVERDASTTETVVESELSNSAPEAIIREDSDSKEEAIAKYSDQENAVCAPSEVSIPSEEATQDADSESARENEGGESEASEKRTGEVVVEGSESQAPTAPVELVKGAADDRELDETNSKANQDHEMEAEDNGSHTTPVQMEKMETSDESTNSLEKDAQPVQTMESPGTHDGTPSDDANVENADAQDTMSPTLATESLETPLIASQEQAHGTSEPSNDAPVVEMPDAGEATENDTKNSSPPVDEGPVAVETTEAEQVCTNTPQAEGSGVPEEKALSNIADDNVDEDIATPAAEANSHATKSPEEDATEASGSAEISKGDSAVGRKPEADEVTSQPVIEDAEIRKPAAEGPPTEPVAGEPAAECPEDIITEEPADQAKQASETVVVEAADTGVCELSGEQGPTKTLEPAAEESSEQSVEANADQISEQPADTTEDATPSTTAIGSEMEEQVCQEPPLSVLAEEAQPVKATKELEQTTPEDLCKSEEITEAPQPVDTAPKLEETSESNEESSPAQQPMSASEEQPVEQPQLEDAAQEPEERPEEAQAPRPESPQASVQEPIAEAEVLPEDSISQQTRCRTISDSSSGGRSPLIEEAALDEPAQDEDAAPSLSKHSPKVSFDEPPVSTKGKEPASPPKERRKSSKSSSSNRHNSSRHKVKDVSRPQSDQKPPSAPTSSPRRNLTTATPQPGLFRRLSTTNSRSSRAEAAEQAEIRRRAAELAAREQEVQRQLERARKRVALEEQERLLREKEEELARLRAAEQEKKRARREEQKRREQEALEQERLARERAEEEARVEELERAERRKRRRESERARHGDARPRHHRHSSKRETEVRDVSPTAKPKVRRQRTEDISSEHQRSRGDYDTREAPSSSRRPEERRHHRSSRRDLEKADKPKKSIWKSIFAKI